MQSKIERNMKPKQRNGAEILFERERRKIKILINNDQRFQRTKRPTFNSTTGFRYIY